MIEQEERVMRELVIQLWQANSQKVISEVIEEWDRIGSGSFALFVTICFPIYWLEKARLN